MFEVEVLMVFSNFCKKNQSAIIKLDSFKYEDAIKEIKKAFKLPEESELIGISSIKDVSHKI